MDGLSESAKLEAYQFGLRLQLREESFRRLSHVEQMSIFNQDHSNSPLKSVWTSTIPSPAPDLQILGSRIQPASRDDEKKRYAELFKAHVLKNNSDVRFLYSKQHGIRISKSDSVVFECPYDEINVKNAYVFWRLTSNGNLNTFISRLQALHGEVPDSFATATPPSLVDVETGKYKAKCDM